MPKRHEWAVLVVPGEFIDDPTKWEVQDIKEQIQNKVEIGNNGFVEIVDLLDYAKELEALREENSELKERLDV